MTTPLVLKKSTFAEDEAGEQVFLAEGDSIDHIQDAGPVERHTNYADSTGPSSVEEAVVGWNVSFIFIPKHRQWRETVTMDAVKLLKALNGQ